MSFNCELSIPFVLIPPLHESQICIRNFQPYTPTRWSVSLTEMCKPRHVSLMYSVCCWWKDIGPLTTCRYTGPLTSCSYIGPSTTRPLTCTYIGPLTCTGLFRACPYTGPLISYPYVGPLTTRRYVLTSHCTESEKRTHTVYRTLGRKLRAQRIMKINDIPFLRE